MLTVKITLNFNHEFVENFRDVNQNNPIKRLVLLKKLNLS
jgi:hypothetical protein